MFLKARFSSTGPALTAMLLGGVFVLGTLTGLGLSQKSGDDRPWQKKSPDSEISIPEGEAASAGLRVTSGGHPAEVLRINDGDTFEARVQIWPGMQITTKVRLRGIDAAEFDARCAEEHRLAVAARDALLQLLNQGGVTIGRITPDKYGGRVVASVATRTTPDVSAELLRSGLVRAYHGGRRESWCVQTSSR